MIAKDWVRCPICSNKTRDRIREDTVLINYPLYCPKCKQETLIEAKNLKITVIKEPDTHRQSVVHTLFHLAPRPSEEAG